MVIKSAIAQKLDVSSMQTCILCSGTSTFFSNESLMTHNREFHRENKVVFFKIQELEHARSDLAEKLATMKMELRNLYKRNLAKKQTVELVKQEIELLKLKIKERDRDIKYFKSILPNERSASQPEELIHLFKQRMDKEFYKLLDSISKPSMVKSKEQNLQVSSSTTTEDNHLVKERLSILEQKVSELSDLQSELKQIKAQLGPSKDVSDEYPGKNKETIDKLTSLLREKEREVELLKTLGEKYKESDAMRSKESEILQDKLTKASEIVIVLNDKNKLMVDDLTKLYQSLESSKSMIKDLEQQKSEIQSKISSYENKIGDQSLEIESLQKHHPVNVEDGGYEEKLKLVEQQLHQVEKELKQKDLIIGEQERELVNAYNGQTMIEEDVQALLNEKEELESLIEDLKNEKKDAEKQQSQWQEKVDNLEDQKRSMLEEKEMLVFQLKDFEAYKKQRESMISQLNERVKELEAEKIDSEKELARVKHDKDELQRELKDLHEAHSRCTQEKSELKESYEKSIESLRSQMEQLLHEETQTSEHLQLKLKEQEQDFQQQISQLESEVFSGKDQLQSLTKQLDELKTQHESKVTANNKLQEEVEKLEADIKLNQEASTGTYNSVNTHQSVVLVFLDNSVFFSFQSPKTTNQISLISCVSQKSAGIN